MSGKDEKEKGIEDEMLDGILTQRAGKVEQLGDTWKSEKRMSTIKELDMTEQTEQK